MVSIPLNDPPEAKDRHPAALPTGVVLSLLLHLAPLVLLLILGLWPRQQPEYRPEFVMEMVQLPAPKPAVPQRPLPPPPVPQLTEAPIAEESAPPPPAAPAPPHQVTRPAIVPGGALTHAVPKPAAPSPTLTRPDSLPVPEEKFGSTTRRDAIGGGQQVAASQAFRDFILKQIAHQWVLDVHGPKFSHITLIGPPIVVLPNGMLASPWGKNDPIDLHKMIHDYDREYANAPGRADEVTAIVTLIQAMRRAQPFRLPADDKTGQSRTFQLYFTLGDLPSH